MRILKSNPILFKNIIRTNPPAKTRRILFSEILQSENITSNIGASSSSFYPTEESEVEILTPEEETDNASMEFDQEMHDDMKQDIGADTLPNPYKRPSNSQTLGY